LSARATRTLLLQGIIPHYRIPIFDRLGREVDLTVVHSDPGFTAENTDFRPLYVPDRQLGRFHYQTGLGALAESCDVVIAMFDIHWLASIRLCLSKRGLPFIWWGHGFGRSRSGRGIRTALVKRADALLLYDEAPRAEFVAAGIPTERILIAPNTVEVFEPCLVDDAAARTRFLFVGRLQERKRVDLLIEAFALIADDVPPHVGIDIVGDGEEGEALHALVASRGLTARVRFHGRVTDEVALREVFGRALAYVSPGHVGLGVLHSCAYGVPVITRPGPGHAPEVANVREGETGLFVEAEPAALAAVMKRLALDPGEAQRLGERGHRHYTSSRTPEHMIDGFLRAIDLATR